MFALGGVNGPAATAVADLIVVLGMVSAARLPHAVPFVVAVVFASPVETSGSVDTRSAASRRRVMREASFEPR